MAWTPDVTTSGIFSTLTLQAIVGFVLYFLFEIFRGCKEIYMPRMRSKKGRSPDEELPRYPLGWILPVWKISEEETLRMVGMDGFVFLRFLKMCARLCLAVGCFGLVFLVPIYSTAPGEAGAAGIGRLTMANIVLNGNRLYASCFCTWLFTLLFLYLIYKEYENFTHLRQRFMRDGDPDLSTQQLYSVMVENIPLRYRSSEALRQLFEQLFPGEVVCARIGMKLAPIVKASNQRKQALVKLEQSVAVFEAADRQESKAPLVRVKPEEGGGSKQAMCGGEKVQAIPFFAGQLHSLNARVVQLKQQADALDAQRSEKFAISPRAGKATDAEESASGEKQVAPIGQDCDGTDAEEDEADEAAGSEEENNFTHKSIAGTGFVTFRSMRAQATAYQAAVLSDRYPLLKVFKAPQPEDILWSNLSASLASIKSTASVTKVIYLTGILFWALILAFIAAISKLSNLESFLPFLSSLDPVSYALLEGQLPVIVLVVFIALLPVIFAAVSTYAERRKTGTDVQMEVFTWYFAYQLANVYLVLLAGSVLGAISEALANPSSAIVLLGTALPTVSAFFINLLITMLFSGVPLLLLRIAPLLIWKLFRSCFGERKLTRRMLVEGPLAPAPLKYSVEMPRALYVLCIALTYWVISPFVIFIAGALFGAWFVAWKYQLCYVIDNPVESGGLYWYKLFSYAMTGLMASSVTMVAYMAIREGEVTAPLLFPLPFVVYFAWGYIKDRFEIFSANLAYKQAVHADLDGSAGGSAAAVDTFDAEFYLPPVLAGPNAQLRPQAYRMEGEGGDGLVPLLNEKGCMDAAYFAATEVEIETLEALGTSALPDAERGSGVGVDQRGGAHLEQDQTSEPARSPQSKKLTQDPSDMQPMEIEEADGNGDTGHNRV